MALLRTHDDVITEWSGQQDDSWKANHVEQARDNLTRVRLVQFPKNKDEPLGVTLKLNDSKHCVVARVIHGSMAHRQGTLHVGDEIREVNGTDISNLPLEKIQQLLKNARGDISLKIVPSRRQNEIKQPKLYVRCLYDYDPEKDDLIPCQQAGLAFNCGDVLEIVSRSDNSWWQGIHQHRSDATGLIPSPELQEKRRAGNTEKIIETPTCLWPKNNKLKTKNGNYSARLNTKFDGLALLTYEEVVRKATFSRKTLVLLGAHGVGRRHIKNSLISRYSEKFAYPLPHTSRQPDPSEMNGQCWYFESETKMLAQITRHEFLEYGQHEGSLYGTKLSTIRNIISDGKIPVLDPETPTLKILRCKEFAPYIVFISSPQSFSHTGDTKMDASLQRLITESNDLESRYRHYFDYEIINNSIEETVEELVSHLHKIEHEPEWCPTSWMY